MDVVVQSERCIAFRVDPDAWRHPDITWPNDELIEMSAAAASSESPSAFVAAVLGRILPGERMRSWAIVEIDDGGGIHRGPEESSDPGLGARAVTWLWASGAASDALGDGAAYVESWPTEHAIEGIACVPLVHDGTVRSLIAVWLTAEDTDAIRREVSRLTLMGRLWTAARTERADAADSGVPPGSSVADGLTPRQSDILRAMALGLTNAQISQQIRFSESTVRLESMCIYRHFGVHSRSEAVEAARAAGEL
jgi:DNA-binding CsgD family transcriptional regulator